MSKLIIGKHLNEKIINDLLDLMLPEDREFLISLITDFINSTSERVISMKEAFAASDFEKISLMAHAHGGTSGIMGAREIRKVCYKIESLIRVDEKEAIQELLLSLGEIALHTAKDLELVIEFLNNIS